MKISWNKPIPPLLSCLCGSRDVDIHELRMPSYLFGDQWWVSVNCLACQLIGPNSVSSNIDDARDEAVRLWNRNIPRTFDAIEKRHK
jgi:hypothetical protein